MWLVALCQLQQCKSKGQAPPVNGDHPAAAGTMLFGESQDYSTACQLLDTCTEAGVDFFDTAEMYPVPQRADTQGLSEVYLGRWMKERNCRWVFGQELCEKHRQPGCSLDVRAVRSWGCWQVSGQCHC